jgi:glycosyltransferase involved in cell wall biosynthesis
LLYRWLTPRVLVGRPRPCKFVHTYHGHIFHSYYGPLKTRVFVNIERALARLVTDRIVVVSEQQRREINEEFRVGRSDQFAVIPLGLDVRVFANWRERRRRFRDELGASESDLLVGIVGRLTEVKNHDLFLRSAALCKESVRARVRFVVIGDGHLRNRLEDQARTLGLAEHVVFTGTRKDPEFFYPALDIVALTSRNEGTPLTLIEAMLNARPVIATAVGGVVDLLGDTIDTSEAQDAPYSICQRGVRVPPNDATAFAAGLTRLIDDEALRRTTGERGREFAEQHFAKERLLDDITTLYSQLVGEQPVAVSARSDEGSLQSRVL